MITSLCILNESIIFVSEDENGNPVAVQENSPIPSTVLQEIHDLQTEGLSFEDAIINSRGALVPTGYTLYMYVTTTLLNISKNDSGCLCTCMLLPHFSTYLRMTYMYKDIQSHS
jgi:hypothetical protein